MGLLFIPLCTEPDIYSVTEAKNNLRILVSQPLGNQTFRKTKKDMRY
jgi:hypothetical protein